MMLASSGACRLSRQEWAELSKRYEARGEALHGRADPLSQLLALPGRCEQPRTARPAAERPREGGADGEQASDPGTVLVPPFVTVGAKRGRDSALAWGHPGIQSDSKVSTPSADSSNLLNGVVSDTSSNGHVTFPSAADSACDRVGGVASASAGPQDPARDVFGWDTLPLWVTSDDVDRATEAAMAELIEETRALRKRQKTGHGGDSPLDEELLKEATRAVEAVEERKNRKRKRPYKVVAGAFLHVPSLHGMKATRYALCGSGVQPKKTDFPPHASFKLLMEEDEFADEAETLDARAVEASVSRYIACLEDVAAPVDDGTDVEEERPAKRRKKSQGLSKKAKEKLLKEEDKARKKAWKKIVKSEMPRASRKMASIRSGALVAARKAAQSCQKEVKKRAMKNSKIQKEANNRGRKLAREMLAYWRKFDRDERDRQKAEQKAELERLKMEEEVREAKRQQKKLNFLLTQTELFAHFIGKKVGVDVESDAAKGKENEAMEVEVAKEVDVENDEETEEEMRARAKAESDQRLAEIRKETAQFDADSERARASAGADKKKQKKGKETEMNPEVGGDGTSRLDMITSVNHTAEGLDTVGQPTLFRGQLKAYQLKGLNWLANLYEQGINGILADEMGLGKTVQSISLLAHLAESKGIWGPFLIVTPTSTLHNWQRELSQFCPALKVIPYWGKQAERKIIRKYWNPKSLYRKDSPFHVLVTSYNIVTMDEKYFKRLKWQYMILDEAQAMKSSSSQRWKILLGFNCRNRLLLTGTPIQNNMAELWALLHFIMPKFFDSHQEFNEWFSRGIESHASEKGQKHRGLGAAITDQQIQRLHMILKPFMMRRIKKDVEKEIADKVEITIHCELTQRQARFYEGIRRKISIAELLNSKAAASSEGVVKRLMNLVMQFRKVCNHPDIFERRETDSPLFFGNRMHSNRNPLAPVLPRLFLQFEEDMKRPLRMRSVPLVDVLSPCLPAATAGPAPGVCSAFPSPPLRCLARLLDLAPAQMHEIAQPGMDIRYEMFERLRARSALRALRAQVYDGASARPTILIPRRSDCASLDGLIRRDPFAPLHKNDHTLSVVRTTFFQRPRVTAPSPTPYISQRAFVQRVHAAREEPFRRLPLLSGDDDAASTSMSPDSLLAPVFDRVSLSYITVPDLHQLLCDCGKLRTLDNLLMKLKAEGHRCLIYSQMTKMIDILEEFLTYRQHRYIRLDGSSKLEDRRDMVEDWQTQPDIFCFLLSTRAGGIGINLTAADTVIFYDSDWNPTIDAQAMDRAHRLGQTKQVTVYRLITRNTIEERILNRAREKHEIQTIVMKGGKFKPDQQQQKEMVSLLLDDAEVEEQLMRRRATKGK